MPSGRHWRLCPAGGKGVITSPYYLLIAPRTLIYDSRRELVFPAAAVRGTTLRAHWQVIIGDSRTQTLIGAGQTQRILLQGRECHVEVLATQSSNEVPAADLIEADTSIIRRLSETEYKSFLRRLTEPLHTSAPYFPPPPVKRNIDSCLPAAYGPWQEYLLSLAAHRLTLSGAITDLMALDLVRTRVEPYTYQLRTALDVLQRKSGVALIADEVGLGKTIEAGLIMKEYMVRGVIRRCLLIAPASLVPQWQAELRAKFGEEFRSPDDTGFRGFGAERHLIVSYNQFVRHLTEIATFFWDLVLVDEAHYLARPTSERRRSVAQLRRRYMLLLTATPLSNYLTDLWSLVDLLRPGLLGTVRQFRSTYAQDNRCRQIKPEMAGRLRRTLADVMVRTRRADTDLPFVSRHVETCAVTPQPAEQALFAGATAYMRQVARAHTGQQRLLITDLLALQQSLSSSPQAASVSLRARLQRHPDQARQLQDLIAQADAIGAGSKEQALQDLIRQVPDEPVLVFTSRLETARRLREVLGDAAGVFAGIGQLGTDKQARQEVLTRFQCGALQYLICTDAAAEGLNLQHCRLVVNFDLHWNPMRIEQRIGRVHRLGQTEPVQVVNLLLSGTIDMHVYEIVYQKIELFRETVGGLETIVTSLNERAGDLEQRILQIMLGTDDPTSVRQQLNQVASDLADVAERERLRQAFTRGVLDPA